MNEVNNGYFGNFGGRFVPENLNKVLDEIKDVFYKYKDDSDFNREFMYYLKYYVGRPSPLYYAKMLTKHIGGAKVYLKIS